MERYRVLVVDDSPFMRKIITDLIESDPQFTVIGTATNGIEAIARVEEDKPDVITLDLEMPKMNGIDALQHILKKHKLPVIMLSGISEANTQDTIKALQFGAFDFIRKPTGVGANTQDIHAVGEMLREKLKIAVLIGRRASELKKLAKNAVDLNKNKDVSTKYEPNLTKNDNININNKTFLPKLTNGKKERAKTESTRLESPKNEVQKTDLSHQINQLSAAPSAADSKKRTSTKKGKENNSIETVTPLRSSVQKPVGKIEAIIAIGTSTGGPRALHEVITSLPGDLKAPVVIVQHMPPRFTKSLAERLNSFSQLQVYEAEHGMELENGKAYLAPGGKHMHITNQNGKYLIRIGTEPPVNGHRPSVDVLFESLLELQELERHIVIMTGMGSDGAQGMKKLADQGVASTIAEAEESCVVFGMPRSAIELGAASKVLPLNQIGPELIQLLSTK